MLLGVSRSATYGAILVGNFVLTVAGLFFFAMGLSDSTCNVWLTLIATANSPGRSHTCVALVM